jgi:tetratricopeptide (TPR) repeat protein
VGFSRQVVHPFFPVFPFHPFAPAVVCPPIVVPYYPMFGTSIWLGVARPILPARLVLGDVGLPDEVLTDELAGIVAARRAELAARAAAGIRPDGLDSVFVRIGAGYDAARSLQAGDVAFQAKRYGNATEFYRLAMTREGGDTSSGHLRAGYALLAQTRYREAHHEFQLAMKRLGEDSSLSFQLGELYRDESEKIDHLEQLAKASWQQPRDSHLQTLIGLFLWHDGQTQRAKTFFLAAQRASEGRDYLSARLLEHMDPVQVARR